jgi:hypothetical protein
VWEYARSVLALLFLLLLFLGVSTTTIGGGSEQSATVTLSAAEALPGLPPELAGYETWPKLNAEPIPPRDSDPHLATKEVYASFDAVDGVFPEGTIVVKEGVRPGKDFVGLIATMRKELGANPDHNDWVFVEWAREAADEPFSVLAEGAVCSSCHLQARSTDYVFTQR